MTFATVPLKTVSHLNPTTLSEDSAPLRDFSYAEISDVSLGAPVRWQDPAPLEKLPSRARRVVIKDDVIVSTVRTYLRAVARVEDPPENALVSTGFAVFRPHRIDARFLAYALQEWGFVDTVVSRSVGVSYPGINASEIAQIGVPVPSPEEQRKVADYLDHETAEIDAFIDELRLARSLTLARWSSIRDDGLTGGSRALPDTRVWLGKVDPSWKVGALKYQFSVTLGKMLDEQKQATGERFRYLRASNLRDGVINMDDLNEMPFDTREREKFSLFAGDILVIEGGATAGTGAVLSLDLPGVFFQKTINRLRPISNASPTYFAEILNAYREAGYMNVMGSGSAMPHVTAEMLEELVVPVPPIAVQNRIAAGLVNARRSIDAAVADIDAAITLARERRAALITAAVTGQIDVTARHPSAAEQIQREIEETR